MNVIGIARKSGEYQGQQYDNFLFHCVYPADLKNSVGKMTEVVKVKNSKLPECFGQFITEDDVFALVGEELAFGYDKYQHVNQIRVIEKKAVIET